MRILASFVLFVSACGGGTPPPSGPDPIPVLGDGTHDLANVELTVLVTDADGLRTPRDLGLDPATGALYVVNRSSSVVVVRSLGEAGQSARLVSSAGSEHFLARPSSIAFGAPGFFATAHEEDGFTQPMTPHDFMGPSLWRTEKPLRSPRLRCPSDRETNAV